MKIMNVSQILNLSFEFFKKYLMLYIKAMAVPLGLGVLGALLVFLVTINPMLFILGLLAIPIMCVAFWKGYVITYSLNHLAYAYYKKEEKTIDEAIKITKQNEKELAKYISFCAVILLVCYLPTIIYSSGVIDLKMFFLNPLSIISDLSGLIKVMVVCFINSIFILPFMNFFNQVFFFKKRVESYFDLFLKCFKIDSVGVMLSVIFAILGGIISTFAPPIYLVLALMLNVITYSANTFYCAQKDR